MMSPRLYNIYAEDTICQAIRETRGISIDGVNETNLPFADDTTLIETDREELLNSLKRVKEKIKEKNLLLNIQKTKVMVIDRNHDKDAPFILDGETIEEVDSFVYLGSIINTRANSQQEIRSRIAVARDSMSRPRKIWKSKGISIKLKLRSLYAIIIPILTYGYESWTLTNETIKKLGAFEMWS